jgi:hypothetical protein
VVKDLPEVMIPEPQAKHRDPMLKILIEEMDSVPEQADSIPETLMKERDPIPGIMTRLLKLGVSSFSATSLHQQRTRKSRLWAL